jgi:DAK2 domain fusion protein YloV
LRQTIDGAAFRRMMLSAAASIDQGRQKINELNVFPVPDGDTGTNMGMTLDAAAADLRKAEDPTLTKAADMAASAMLRGARGNSGVILSLLFRGFSNAWKGKKEADGQDFAEALAAGVEAAYKAVMKPAEGTILTVSRLTADAAKDLAQENSGIESVLSSALETSHAALDNTINQNPVLKKAGVVDAGGMGFVVILEAMLASMQGSDVAPQEQAAVKDHADFSEFSNEDIKFTYCTEFIVTRDNDKDPEKLRAFLNELGDSLVLVYDDEIVKVHVHTNHPGTVFEEALTYGAFLTTKIENMRLQHTEKVMSADDLKPAEAKPEKKYGSVAVCAGPGLADVFKDLGTDQIVQGGQTMNPSTEDILEAINRTPAEVVFVLPNNKNIILAAQQAAELTKKTVVVVPSKTVPQGITAMLSFSPDAAPEENLAVMSDALQNVDTMMITYAARDSDFDGYAIHAGDYLGLFNGALLGTSREMDSLLAEMADRVKESCKGFVNIFYGADMTQEQAEGAAAIFTERAPDAEVNVVNGGQPIYYYMISAE